MYISVSGFEFGRGKLERATLREIVGGFEVQFHFSFEVVPGQQRSWVNFYSADVQVGPANGQLRNLGNARRVRPQILRQTENKQPLTLEFVVSLSPHQMGVVEDLRNGMDISFQLQVIGECGFNGKFWNLAETEHLQIARSAWMEQLRAARAYDILLLEVPMPAVDIGPEWREIGATLTRAQRHFIEGNYPECVSLCRPVMDKLGQIAFGEENWHGTVLDMLAVRKAMKRDQRERLMFAAAHWYSNLPHHPDADDSKGSYSRSEAKMLLSLCVLFAERTQRR